MSYNWRTWRMLLSITTSVLEYSYLHSMFAQHKQGDRKAWFHFNSGLLELNLQLYLDEVCLKFHGSIHAPFSAVYQQNLTEILETPITILCSSTKIERCYPRNILVELHKTLIPKKVFSCYCCLWRCLGRQQPRRRWRGQGCGSPVASTDGRCSTPLGASGSSPLPHLFMWLRPCLSFS